MASEQNHVTLANRNQLLLGELVVSRKHSEWIATVAFYKAIHLVEAVFANKHRQHSTAHSMRQNWLKTDNFIKGCYGAYFSLKTASLVARYLEADGTGKNPTFESFMPMDDVIEKLVYGKLVKVEGMIISHLSTASQKLLVRVPEKPKT